MAAGEVGKYLIIEMINIIWKLDESSSVMMMLSDEWEFGIIKGFLFFLPIENNIIISYVMCERVYTRNGAIINIIDFNCYHESGVRTLMNADEMDGNVKIISFHHDEIEIAALFNVQQGLL